MARPHNPAPGRARFARSLAQARRALAAPGRPLRAVSGRLRLGLALWLFGAALSGVGCAAPTAGLWTGTADVGPREALPLAFSLPVEQPDHRFAGEIELRLADGPARFTICRGQARNHAIEIELDWTHRDCKVPAGAQPDRRLLRGSYGPGVIAGDILQATASGLQRVGFFRAYRDAPGA